MDNNAVNGVRRMNLRSLIEERFEGNRSAFCRATGRNVNLINLILTSNEDLRRNLGERQARDIEVSLKLPSGWMDVDRSKEGSMVRTASIMRFPGFHRSPVEMIPDRLMVSERWIMAALPTVTETDKLVVAQVVDNAMGDTLREGDVAIVDTSVTAVDADGVYLFRRDEAKLFRRAQRRFDGTLEIRADGPGYDATVLTSKEEKSIIVVGRVLSRLRHSRL